MKRDIFILFLIALLLIPSISAIQEGQINVVTDSENNLREPLENAFVKIEFSDGSSLETITDENGKYQLNIEDVYCWEDCNIYPTIYTKDMEIMTNTLSTKYNIISSNKDKPRGVSINIYEELETQQAQKEPAFQDILENENLKEFQKDGQGYNIYWKGNLTFDSERERTIKFSFSEGKIVINGEEHNLEEDQEITVSTMEENTLELNYFISQDKEPNIYVLDNDEFVKINENQLLFEVGSYSKQDNNTEHKFFAASSLPQPDLSVTPGWIWLYFLDRDLNKDPVLFIHGLHGSDNFDESDLNTFNYWYDEKIPLELKEEGFESYELIWIPANLSSRIYSFALQSTLQDLQQEHSVNKIDIVAHSMGGLLVRAYMEDLGVFPVTGNPLLYENEIGKVAFLGTPNHGSYLANRVIRNERPSCISFARLLPEDETAEAYQELSVGSLFLWELNNIQIDNPGNFISIVGVNDIACFPDDISESADINHAFDGFVSVSSASLLEQQVPLVTLKLNHASIKGGHHNGLLWTDYVHDTSNDVSPIIADFFRSNNRNSLLSNIQSYLGSGEYAIFPGLSNNPYETGAVVIKADASQVKIRDSSNNDYILTPWASDIWFYFDDGGNGLAVPIGEYDIYLDNVKQDEKLNVRGAQTNTIDFTPQVPEVNIIAPLDESVINNVDILLRFDTKNWNVEGKGNKHIHFHIDNVPGLNFQDHLMFYNSPDNLVELNNQQGPTPFATWIDEETIEFNNVPNGLHQIRAHLADESHNNPGNPEADKTIQIFVSSTENIYGLTGNNSGIDDDAILGNQDTPVTIIEFADYQGPFGKKFFDETFPLIKSQYIDTGMIRFVYRDFPLNSLHPFAQFSAEAAECVGEQGGDGAYYDMYNALFSNQEDSPVDLADNLGYNITDCLSSGQMAQEVVQDYLDAQAYGIEGTPAFLINGEMVSGAQPFNVFKEVIDQAINDSIVCFSDLECSDDDENTEDTCIHPGTLDAICENNFVTMMDVNSPQNDIYNDRRIPFEIELNEMVDEITYIDLADDRGRERTLCSRDCDSYGLDRERTESFSDGEHEVSIKAIKDEVVVDEKIISFMTDSREPRISRTEPRRGFSNGIFNVEFDEENPQELTLFYGNSIRNKTVNVENDCVEARRGYECKTEADVSDFDGGNIEYWFELTDIAGSKDESRHEELSVDISNPIIENLEYEMDGRRVYFTMNVIDNNFDEVYYLDNSDERARERSICRRLDGTLCEGRASFRDGEHNITIYAVDEAGNIAKENLIFFVDSRDPRISRTEPRRGFASGVFNVEFDEENPISLFLNYGNSQTGFRNQEVDIDNSCFMDRRYECETSVNLSDYHGQEIVYWFNITDILNQTDQSREEELGVDSVAPILNNPDSFWEQGEGRYERYIYFTFNITEENFDEINYIDLNDDRPRERRLCSRLRDGICETRKSFRTGDYNLQITILDEAGNSIKRFIEFSVS